MKKIINFATAALAAVLLALTTVVPLIGAIDESQQMNLMDKEAKFEKEKGEYLQTSVLDKILGPGKAIVIVDVQMGIEAKVVKQAAKENKIEKKKRLGDIDYLLLLQK